VKTNNGGWVPYDRERGVTHMCQHAKLPTYSYQGQPSIAPPQGAVHRGEDGAVGIEMPGEPAKVGHRTSGESSMGFDGDRDEVVRVGNGGAVGGGFSLSRSVCGMASSIGCTMQVLRPERTADYGIEEESVLCVRGCVVA